MTRAQWLRLQLGVAQFDGPFPSDPQGTALSREAAAVSAAWRQTWSPALVEMARWVVAYGAAAAARYPAVSSRLPMLGEADAAATLRSTLATLHESAQSALQRAAPLGDGFTTFVFRCEALRTALARYAAAEAAQLPWVPPAGAALEEDLGRVLKSFELIHGIWSALAADLKDLAESTAQPMAPDLVELLRLQLEQAASDWTSVAGEAQAFSQEALQVYAAPAAPLQVRYSGRSLALAQDGQVVRTVQFPEPSDPWSQWRLVPFGDGSSLLVGAYGRCVEVESPRGELLAEDPVQLRQNTFTGNPEQRWSVTPSGDGWVRFLTLHPELSGRCLSVPAYSNEAEDAFTLPQGSQAPASPDPSGEDGRPAPAPGAHQMWRLQQM
ncbi:hypothetical protein P2318_33290 [Myxococcaceae bacterium GXIMD 01537]